ncbi:MAG TPA: IPT/TIG domain-containing protein [Terriglobales bacterium]|nr:IPT/TIG domain-containing protein [Terriglobales bacterium]
MRSSFYLRIVCFCLFFLASLAGTAQISVTTNHNDNARTGQNLSESILTTSNVNVSNFGKLFFRTVDGYIFAQPLYLSGLNIGGVTRNVVFVATEHNSVYAFDADDPNHPAPLWHVNLGTPVPSNDVCIAVSDCPYDDLQPEIGITSTPVIDTAGNAIYVVSHTKNTSNSTYHFWLHKLSLTTGADILSPVEITTTSPQDTFEPLFQLNRPGMLLLNNTIYVAFGSAGDFGDWHGWVMSYDAITLSQLHVYNSTPRDQQNFVPGESGGGGIFSCGQGLIADTNGYIYFFTGNGPINATGDATGDYGDSAIKLRASDLAFIDYFSPSDALTLGQNNIDLGAGGPLLIPNTNPGLLVGGGKDGVLRVLDTSNMGKFNTSDQVVQEWQAITNSAWIMGSPVYWDSPTWGPVIYLWVSGNVAKAWKFNGSTFQTTPVSSGSISSPFGESDTSPISLSANGQTAGTGILWAPTSLSGDPNKAAVPGIFHALDAGNLSHELWNSQQSPARDGVGIFAKFTPPTVANGKVYLGTFSGQLLVYGLNPPAPSGIAYVQGTSKSLTTSSSQVAATYSSSQKAGDLNLVVVGWADTTSTIQSVTDSHGNAYSVAVPRQSSSSVSQAIYYAKNIVGGTNTVTVNFNQSASLPSVRILEYSGVDTSSPLDVTANSQGSGGTANSGSATTNFANELIFGADTVSANTLWPGAPFISRVLSTASDMAEDHIVNVVDSYNATTSVSAGSNWVMQMATFKAAGQGSGNPTPTVTGISPTSGSSNGGTALTITGTGFLAGATVSLGGTAATGITVVSSTKITATAPAHAAGAVNVVVTNTDGQSGTLAGGYTYTSASSTIAFVQAKSATPQSPTATVSVPAMTQTAGNLNIVAVGWNDSVSSITSISDTLHNTYNIAAVLTTGTNLRQVIYYAQNIAGGSNSVTVTFNQAVPFADVRVLEYSGLSTTAAFDAALGNSGSGATASAGPLTTASANELVFAAAMTGGVINSAGSGFTARIKTPDGDIGEDELAAATGSYTATAPVTPYNGTSTWVMQVAAFKAGP